MEAFVVLSDNVHICDFEAKHCKSLSTVVTMKESIQIFLGCRSLLHGCIDIQDVNETRDRKNKLSTTVSQSMDTKEHQIHRKRVLTRIEMMIHAACDHR